MEVKRMEKKEEDGAEMGSPSRRLNRKEVKNPTRKLYAGKRNI